MYKEDQGQGFLFKLVGQFLLLIWLRGFWASGLEFSTAEDTFLQKHLLSQLAFDSLKYSITKVFTLKYFQIHCNSYYFYVFKKSFEKNLLHAAHAAIHTLKSIVTNTRKSGDNHVTPSERQAHEVVFISQKVSFFCLSWKQIDSFGFTF